MEFVSFRPCTRNWKTDEPLELGATIDPLNTEDAMDRRRDECNSEVDRFRPVDCGGYGSCDTRGRENASFDNVGVTGGNGYAEGVKGERPSLTDGVERNPYAEGVKGGGESAIVSGRGGTGGISKLILFRGETKTRSWSTTAAARERVDLLDDRDLSPLDVTDSRRDSTLDCRRGGSARGCGWDWDWDWVGDRI